MNKLPISKEGMISQRERYEKLKIPYDLEVTTSSVTFTGMGVTTISSGTNLSNQDLMFISRVSMHIMDRLTSGLVSLPEKPKEKIPMCMTGMTKRSTAEKKEIDINSAYWCSAYLQGFISREIYDMANSPKQIRLTQTGANKLGIAYTDSLKKKYFDLVSKTKDSVIIKWNQKEYTLITEEFVWKYHASKEVRLIALGALAKKTEYFHFDGRELKSLGVRTTDQRLVDVWQAICYKVHSLMNDIRLSIPKKDFILYWVDALIVDKESVQIVIDKIKEAGFKYKEKDIRKVFTYAKSVKVFDSDNKNDFRVFNIS